jgi:hypothetical protein
MNFTGPKSDMSTGRITRRGAASGLLLAVLALCWTMMLAPLHAQEAENNLHIHGDTPLPERLEVWADEVLRPMQLDDPGEGPIGIRLALDKPGYVTLVIENENGVRVRNLISERYFEAGEHVVGWDGLDEAGVPAFTQGSYDLLPNLVRPGVYRVRGLVRDKVNLVYELSANTPGSPPWNTPDSSGGWLSDHSPPSGMVSLPADRPRMLIASFIAEAGHGLVWTDLDGRKLSGERTIGAGGGWWGGYLLARDAVQFNAPEAYLTGAWKGTLELWSIHPNRKVFTYSFTDQSQTGVEGVAVRDGLAVLSLDKAGQLLFVDVAAGQLYAQPEVERPRGLTFDGAGRLLAVSGDRLLRFTLPEAATDMILPEPEVLIPAGLEHASQITMDSADRIYIGFRGSLHQVKVYSPEGEFLHDIGEPGGVQLGLYNPLRMHNPAGLAISADNRLWVAENSSSPKRISIWSLDGKLEKWLVGPPQYGGGGSLSADKKRFYYAGNGNAGLEFAVDWEGGTSTLANIYYLPGGPGDIGLSPGTWVNAPQTPILFDDREYLTNAYNSHPTRGVDSVVLWIKRNGIAIAVAAIGRPEHLAILKGEEFQARRQATGNQYFAWSDLNGNGQVQSEEVTFTPELAGVRQLGPLVVGRDLSISSVGGLVWRPQEFTEQGVPIYDAAKVESAVEDLMVDAGAAGGCQALIAADGTLVTTGGPLRGFRDGQLVWSYPNRWPSLDTCHWGFRWQIARIPSPAPGLVVGTTRLVGATVTAAGEDAGELWALNGNTGSIYLFTTDGLFVATLFPDQRVPGAADACPPHERGVLLNNATPGEEHFWPTINPTADGGVFLVSEIKAGGRRAQSNVVRVDGLDSIRRIPAAKITLTPTQLAAAHKRLIDRDAQRIKRQGRKVYPIAISNIDYLVDGKLDEWPAPWVHSGGRFRAATGADGMLEGVFSRTGEVPEAQRETPVPNTPGGWVQIGEIPRAHRYHPLLGALRVADGILYLAFSVSPYFGQLDPMNSPSVDAADLLTRATAAEIALSSDPDADPERTEPGAGDIRVLFSMHEGHPLAVVYRAAAADSEPHLAISSEWRQLKLGSITDISEKVQVAQSAQAWEVAVPLEALGIDAREGKEVRADFGLHWRPCRVLDNSGRRIRVAEGTTGIAGHQERTRQSIYWHNRATEFVPDAVGEAMFTPQLWGVWTFRNAQ